MLQKILVLLWVMCGFIGTANAGQLSANVNPQRVAYGESVRFELSYDGDDAGTVQPDLSVLNKDFSIYSTSSSMQSSYVNGVGQQKRVWTLLLMPKYEGKLQIPAITAGAYKTAPLEVEVLPAGSKAPTPTAQNNAPQGQNTAVNNMATTNTGSQNSEQGNDGNFWAELTVNNKNPFVHQEITATLVIYDQKGIDLQMPAFENTQDWLIEMVGNPEITEKNGQRIIKINYSLVPQKSGALTVPSVRVEGTYLDTSSTPVTNSFGGLMKMFDFNFDFQNVLGTQKPIMLRTSPININVKPIPEDYGAHWWLPAEALVMNAKWSDAKPVFKVGEAVTREITVLASGVAAEDLPELNFADNSAWKQYPEKPQLNSVMHNGRRIAQAVTRIVYIPQKNGEQEVPEVKLRWYNVRTNHIETAIIPAEKMYVAGDNQALPTAENESKNTTQTQVPADYDNAVNKAIDEIMHKVRFVAGIVLAFLAGLVISFLFLRRRSHTEKEQTASDCVKQIEHALKSCDYRLLRDNLLKWGEQVYVSENITNLNDLSNLIGNEKFNEQMLKLSGILYAGKQETLDDKVITDCLKHGYKKTKKHREKPLPDLYK